jgi:predicted DsbA family dithiol-disulfide isomerase
MQIDIVSDTICPWCYVGKRRLERALKERPELDVTVEWHAFQLNPEMPVEGVDRQTYMVRKFGSEQRVAEIFDTIAAAGRQEGIPFAFDRIARIPKTVDSHRLIRWAGPAGCQDAVVEQVFRRYFEQGEDISDTNVLVQVAVEAGLDGPETERFLSGAESTEDVRAENLAAHRLGISGVPCFIFEKKYAVSGAQEPEVFFQVFDMPKTPVEAAGQA